MLNALHSCGCMIELFGQIAFSFAHASLSLASLRVASLKRAPRGTAQVAAGRPGGSDESRQSPGGSRVLALSASCVQDVSAAQRAASVSGGNGNSVAVPWCVPSGYVRPAPWMITPKPGALILKSLPLVLVST